MSNQTDEGMENMPIWQDHERRITTLENTFASFSHEMKEVKTTVQKSNDEQKKLLNTLIDHHLNTNKTKLSNLWKVIINITGAGGLLTVIIYALFQFFGQ
ncbi:hypothetical protein F9U64_01095 [Gracilibacillus oryzae]|uniref:Haemolysin XhlA n=1 Tax=Gracilibacillus oryzae TaxID=1672701 RepID=A0A7C8GWZ9_9BACI|nr:hypothetical protein [Gracilibacillus oryzae]KAB8139249.1 hypothetical protein F9U64_01095 [Gracilibacillus oryzae]